MRYTLGIALLGSAFFLFSCTKDTTIADRTNNGVLLKNAGGDCMPINVAGTYTAGITTGSTNYIEVQANFAKDGIFQISTDSLNGFYFSGQGPVTAGTDTLRLKSHGTPVLTGTNVFTVSMDTTACTVNVIVL